jgi:hypothetical protein
MRDLSPSKKSGVGRVRFSLSECVLAYVGRGIEFSVLLATIQTSRIGFIANPVNE